MNPEVGLGLAQIELQSMPRLQRVRLLVDQDGQQLVLKAWQCPFGSATCTALADFAFARPFQWRAPCVGGPKGWQKFLKLFQR
jgi:hypothetical protein